MEYEYKDCVNECVVVRIEKNCHNKNYNKNCNKPCSEKTDKCCCKQPGNF